MLPFQFLGAAFKVGGIWGTQAAVLSADTEQLPGPAWPHTGTQHIQTAEQVLLFLNGTDNGPATVKALRLEVYRNVKIAKRDLTC